MSENLTEKLKGTNMPEVFSQGKKIKLVFKSPIEVKSIGSETVIEFETEKCVTQNPSLSDHLYAATEEPNETVNSWQELFKFNDNIVQNTQLDRTSDQQLQETDKNKELPTAIPSILTDTLTGFAPYDTRLLTVPMEITTEFKDTMLSEGINFVDMSKTDNKKKRIIFITRDIAKSFLCCTECKKAFNERAEFMDHKFLHKRGKIELSNPKFQCSTCSAKFNKYTFYQEHLHFEHKINKDQLNMDNDKETSRKPKDSKIFKCDKCNKVFRNNMCLQSHLESIADAPCCNYMQCQICLIKLTKTDFLQHVKVHPNFMCDICGKNTFISKAALSNHKCNVHRNSNIVCHHCGLELKSKAGLKTHIVAIHAGEKHMCDQCPFITNTHINLRKHIRKIHQPKNPALQPVTCDKCGRTYPRLDRLKEHMRVRHLNKPKQTPKVHWKPHIQTQQYVCDRCPKSYSAQWRLDRHVINEHIVKQKPAKSKTNIKKIKINNSNESSTCKICDKSFRDKYCLMQHYKIHLNIREFKCEKCNITFQTNKSFKGHLELHKNPNFEFSCKICHKYESNELELKYHMQNVHQNLKYQCTFCPKTFGRKHLKYSHESLEHKEDYVGREEAYNLLARQKVQIKPTLVEEPVNNSDGNIELLDNDTVEELSSLSQVQSSLTQLEDEEEGVIYELNEDVRNSTMLGKFLEYMS